MPRRTNMWHLGHTHEGKTAANLGTAVRVERTARLSLEEKSCMPVVSLLGSKLRCLPPPLQAHGTQSSPGSPPI
eukprot:scaffold4258_cov32-Tisochrysis_lutea.AAC.3